MIDFFQNKEWPIYCRNSFDIFLFSNSRAYTACGKKTEQTAVWAHFSFHTKISSTNGKRNSFWVCSRIFIFLMQLLSEKWRPKEGVVKKRNFDAKNGIYVSRVTTFFDQNKKWYYHLKERALISMSWEFHISVVIIRWDIALGSRWDREFWPNWGVAPGFGGQAIARPISGAISHLIINSRQWSSQDLQIKLCFF